MPPHAALPALMLRARLLFSLCLPLSLILAPSAGAATATATPGGAATPGAAGTPSPTASPRVSATATPASGGKASAAAPTTSVSPSASASPRAVVSPPLQSGLGVTGWYPLVTYPLWDRMQLQVNVADGNLLAEATDLAIKGTGHDLVIGRVWQSLAVPAGYVAAFDNWAMSAGQDVQLVNAGSSAPVFVDGTGAQYTFTQQGSGYASPPGIDATLVKNQDQSFTLTFHATGERYTFGDSPGQTGGFPSVTADTDQNGNAIAYTYSTQFFTQGLLASIADTQGRQVSVAHGGLFHAGGVATLTDPTGRTWQYGYDTGSDGDLLTYTDPNGKQTLYGYNASTNDLTQITDPNANVTKLVYDAQHRVTAITFGQGSPVAGTYTFAYNAGNTVVTDPNNHQTTYAFDSQQRLTKVTDALSNSVQYSWTSDNHVQQHTDAKNQVFAYGYNGNNSLTSIQLPTGATTSWAYTDSSHPFYPTSVTDPQGNTTSTTYDANGNVKTVTNQLPSQNQTQYFYNANGTVDHIIDARGNTTSLSYDQHGNLTAITPPAPMHATAIVPDGLSRVQSVTDGNGNQRTYTYDLLDRTTALQYPSYSAGNVTWSIDSDGNVTSMADGSGTTTYQFDARNRQTQKTLPATLGGGTLTYGYDLASNLTSFTDAASVPGQSLAVTYHYNPADLVDSMVENGKTTAFSYDRNHRRTGTTYPDGVALAQGYDNSGRLSSIGGAIGSTTLSSFSYSYTKPGGGDTLLPYTYSEALKNPDGSVSSVNGQMSYDQLNRLTKWLVTKQSDGSTVHDYAYQFDGNSNRTQVIADPVNSQGQIVPDPSQGLPHSNESDLGFNAANEISQIQPYSAQGQAQTVVNYSYDVAGQQLGNDGGGTGKPLTITYNPNNQTRTVSNTNQDAVTMSWAGAGQTQRLGRSWTNHTTQQSYTSSYTWSLLGLSGYADTSKPVTSWIVLDPTGVPVAQRYANGTEYYYLFDGQRNVVALEGSGQVQASYDYCPTGNIVGGTPLTPVGLANPLRQAATPYDDDNKDYFLRSGLISESDSATTTQGPAVSIAGRNSPKVAG